ncbi:hypothetical protein TCAL_05444 [Tigriopus californicus]|uniref:Uncharacterized protein n=1 Tax=Tigriopus californicus TaxID=6832 RepID=A0A553NXE7_TIGCA|nr:ethanolamine-phosphate phospho-lyase-like isoform X2 [Tigriopus californicus]TRY70098.1 hypothetical protein TCAL_05444 [Tigriopus californicus]
MLPEPMDSTTPISGHCSVNVVNVEEDPSFVIPPSPSPTTIKASTSHESPRSPGLRSVDIRKASFGSGKGCVIQSTSGVQYIDCVSKDVLLGHANLKIMETTNQQTLSSNVGLLHTNTAELTRRLVSLLPAPLTACFFVNSYSEANDLALTMAACYTGSEEVICLEKADHGKTSTCLKISRDRSPHFGKCRVLNTVPIPDSYRGKIREGEFPVDDIGWMYSGDVKEVCHNIVSESRKVGAFICEPIIHQAGHISLPDRYLTEVYRCVQSHQGILISDETYSGLGRTGDFTWGFQKYDVIPDIVTIGKGLANGHPLAAVVTSKEIAKKITSIVSYYNFLGDPISCAIALSVLEQLDETKVLENVRKVGKYLLLKLSQFSERFDFVGQVRGQGLSLALDLVHSDSREPNTVAAQFVRQKMFERQVVVELSGFHRSIIGLSPPLVLTMQEAMSVALKMSEVLQEAEKVFGRKRQKSDDENTDDCFPKGHISNHPKRMRR